MTLFIIRRQVSPVASHTPAWQNAGPPVLKTTLEAALEYVQAYEARDKELIPVRGSNSKFIRRWSLRQADVIAEQFLSST